jgi:hypothetical protein
MPTYFKIDRIDGGYTWQDFDIMDVGVEYATEVLDIPEEYIEDVISFYGRHIEISLVEDPSYVHEDWYYALLPYVD